MGVETRQPLPPLIALLTQLEFCTEPGRRPLRTRLRHKGHPLSDAEWQLVAGAEADDLALARQLLREVMAEAGSKLTELGVGARSRNTRFNATPHAAARIEHLLDEESGDLRRAIMALRALDEIARERGM